VVGISNKSPSQSSFITESSILECYIVIASSSVVLKVAGSSRVDTWIFPPIPKFIEEKHGSSVRIFSIQDGPSVY
jgi:hypothetical protein